ncbi:MAG: 30S ribosomal protein S9, partial [Acidobacteriaceae bacterium]
MPTTPKKAPAPRKPHAAKPAAARKPKAKKETVKPVAAPEEIKESTAEPIKPAVAKHVGKTSTGNFYAVGKRKNAVAQAILTSGNGTITVNELPIQSYFMTPSLQHIVFQPLV